MANIEIKFTAHDGSIVTDTPSLAVVKGETFTVTSSGGSTALVFSPDLSAAVSPQPQPHLTLADAQSIAFTFTSSGPAGYFIAYGPAGVPLNADFPPEVSTMLYLQTTASVIAVARPSVVLRAVAATGPKGGSGPVLNPQGA